MKTEHNVLALPQNSIHCVDRMNLSQKPPEIRGSHLKTTGIPKKDHYKKIKYCVFSLPLPISHNSFLTSGSHCSSTDWLINFQWLSIDFRIKIQIPSQARKVPCLLNDVYLSQAPFSQRAILLFPYRSFPLLFVCLFYFYYFLLGQLSVLYFSLFESLILIQEDSSDSGVWVDFLYFVLS